MPLEYINNFWRSLKILLINYKVELKLRWAKYCALAVAGVDNTNKNPNNIFTMKDKFYAPTVTISTKDNQKLSKHLSKGFEISVCWNEYKTKIEDKNKTNKYRYFLESNYMGVNRLLTKPK